MTLDDEKNIVNSARRCQRNWDLTKSVDPVHIEHWIYLAQHAPSKQDESYYDLYVITNSSLIQELLDHTWGFTFNLDPSLKDMKGVARNSQMGANVYFLFTIKEPTIKREHLFDKSYYSNMRDRNACISAGIAGSLISYSANRLGYKTGFNTNHNYHAWVKILNIPKDKSMVFGIGIGHPQEHKDRNQTDETDYYVFDHPEGVAFDPNYGQRHSITEPRINFRNQELKVDKISYPTFSELEKDIKVFRFD